MTFDRAHLRTLTGAANTDTVLMLGTPQPVLATRGWYGASIFALGLYTGERPTQRELLRVRYVALSYSAAAATGPTVRVGVANEEILFHDNANGRLLTQCPAGAVASLSAFNIECPTPYAMLRSAPAGPAATAAPHNLIEAVNILTVAAKDDLAILAGRGGVALSLGTCDGYGMLAFLPSSADGDLDLPMAQIVRINA